MRIPLEFYQLLRNRINLSDVIRQKVSLTRKGSEYLGICPFHNEKTPSFTVNDLKGFYHCFGCSAHGDVIKFVAEMSGMSYNNAAIKLAGDYSIELPKLSKHQEEIYEESAKLLSVLELAKDFFVSELTPEIIKYLNSRGLSEQIIKEYNLGFAPSGNKLQKFFAGKNIPTQDLVQAGLMGRDEKKEYPIFRNRIMFPIRNSYNKVIAFGGRALGDNMPKYLNSPETILFNKSETLYGEHKAISAAYKKHQAILVEGYIDVLALHKCGYDQAVACLGTSVTEAHLQKLWRAGSEIILCLDSDEAGKRATKRAIDLALPLISYERKLSFIQLREGKDPDDIINNKGKEFFETLLHSRLNLSTMIWQLEFAGNSFDNAESKANLEASLVNYCSQIKDRTLSSHYYKFFKDQIWQNLVRYKSKNQNTNVNSEATNTKNKILDYSNIEMLERGLLMVVIKHPHILHSQQVRESLIIINFAQETLSDFRDWLLYIFDNNHEVTAENLAEIVKNTGFSEIFSLLSMDDNLFLKNLVNNNTANYPKLWELLYKKYYLLSLQREYTNIMHNSQADDKYDKMLFYQQEVARVHHELQKLTEFFTI